MWPFKKKDQPTQTTVKKARLTIYTHEGKTIFDLSCTDIDWVKNFIEWYDDKDGDNQLIFGNETDGQRWGVTRSAIGAFYHRIEDEIV